MRQTVDAMAARIDRADGLADALAVGWDAFELIRAGALSGAEQAGGLRGAEPPGGLRGAEPPSGLRGPEPARGLRGPEPGGGLRRAERADELFAAFMLASASAANGRDAVGFAPSLPEGQAGGAGPGDVELAGIDVFADGQIGDLDEFADTLAGLASALSGRLRAAARWAANGADRAACHDAAREADAVRALLGRDG